MKKKLMFITAALIIALAAAGCGQKNATNNNASDNNTQTDVSGAYEQGGTAANSTTSESGNENYSENVDMEKVDGNEIVSETDKDEYEGEIGKSKISIGDAKVFEYEGAQLAVVSIKYTNKSGKTMQFTSAATVNAYQNGERLREEIVTGVEGVELLTASEYVKSGDTITVQQVYRLNDTQTPLEVVAGPINPSEEDEAVTKTFNF